MQMPLCLESWKLSAIPIWWTILVTLFTIYLQSSNVIEPDMNIITCFTYEEYIVESRSRKFAKFCMAASFTLVDLKFVVQQSFSLTLQLLRPALAKVNKTQEWYCHYNALVIVLLVRKIPKMKFLLSCTSSQQDLRRL